MLLVHRNATDICILILYSSNLLNPYILIVFWWNSQCFLYIIPCHLQIVTVLLVPFYFRCLIYLPCLMAVARTSNSLLNKNVRVCIISLFLILVEMLSVCLCWVWYMLWICHIWAVLCCSMILVYPLCWEHLSWVDDKFC